MTRRNFWLGVLNGLFFTLAETLMDSSLVIVAFVGHLTQSTFWLGLVVPLRDGGWFLPQLWTSGYLQSQPRKLRLYSRVAVLRVFVLTLITLAAFWLRSPAWLLVAFFLCFTIYSIASGFAGLPFLEVVGKTIPPHQRGVFFAWRLALGGVSAIGASMVVKLFVDDRGPLAFPYNYALLFGLATVWAAVGLLAYSVVVEPPDMHLRPPASFPAQIQRALTIARADHTYRHFIYLRGALMIAGAATPFFAVYVQRQLGGSLSFIGIYLGVMTTAGLAANILFGRFSARLGNRNTLALGAWAGLAMLGVVLALMLLAAPLRLSPLAASLWLLPAFALAGIRDSGIGISGQPLLLDIAPPAERSLYLGFSNSLLGVVLLSTGLSGLVVSAFGFLSIVVVALAANVFALYAAARIGETKPAPLYEPDITHTAPDAHAAP